MKPVFERGQKVKVSGKGGPTFATVIDMEYQNGQFVYSLEADETGYFFLEKERWIHHRHPDDM